MSKMSSLGASPHCWVTDASPLKDPTPLDPRAFFTGRWIGRGLVRPHVLLRWLIPTDRVRLVSEALWLSDNAWVVRDRIEYGSGAVLEREMNARLLAPDRVAITAPDMPGGAEITLQADGFYFSPYIIETTYRGRRLRLLCCDENVLTGPNSLSDTIRMYWGPFRIATMTLEVEMERAGPSGL